MKHKFLSFLLLMISMVALLGFNAGAADAVDAFAGDMRAFKTEISVPVRDFDALMKETFARYPELSYIYNKSTYQSGANGLTIQMSYRNLNADLDDVYVVDNEDELMAVIGLMMCDLSDGVAVVLANDYRMDKDAIYNRLYEGYYLIAQTLNFQELNGVWWEDYGVTTYDFTPFLCGYKSKETIRDWREQTEAQVLELASTLFAQDMPDYMRLYLIQDWLMDHNSYHYFNDMKELDVVNHVAYGALCAHETVCQGYARAVYLLCEAANIPCYYISGDAGGAHCWNSVQIDGNWYQIDVTWDDEIIDQKWDHGTGNFEYFLITDAQMSESRTWDKSNYPPCTSTALNYHTVKTLIEADTNTYTDYSTEHFRTEEMIRAEFEAILGLNQPTEEPVEEPIEDPEEPVEEPEEPIEEPEEPVKEPEEPVEQPEEPAIEPVLPEELQPVVLIDQKKQQEYVQLNWMALLIGLALFAAVTAIALHCVANSRVTSARSERLTERENKVRNGVRTRRKF